MDEAGNRPESFFRMITESAPYALVLVDHDGRIVLVNAYLEQLFGYSRDELLGCSIDVFIPERFRIGHEAYRQSFNKDPERKPMGMGRDLYGLCKNGEEIPVEIALNPIHVDKKNYVLAAIADITQRKQAEEIVRQSEARLNLALSAARAGTWDWDILQDKVMWSDGSYHLLGLKPGECEASAKNWLERVHPDDRAVVKEAVDSVIKRFMTQRKQDAFNLEYRVLHTDGSIRWVNDRGQVLYGRYGRPVRMIGIMLDVTERKTAEEQLAAQAQELARSNAELQEFAYVASHDLQEPLRAVAGCVEIIRRRYQGKLDVRADEVISHAVDGAARMQNLINDLLAYSRIGSRDQPFEPTDCQAILNTVLANLEVPISESGAKITHDHLPTISADSGQLIQLFQNLISNAVKFRGDRTPQIHIGVKKQNNEWVFAVADNGIGIESPYFERIFRIFQRLHARNDYPGTGIGLAICKRVVERHGGRIWVESEPGRGTTFFFTFPTKLRAIR
ncbi:MULTISPECIES: PAS domain S-box protein [Methylocaldum]|jgi:PAS domain S-box-containing protein|uniref:PAS domain S-box protein n=1 Tax=unclassified Methylocaldum TaxID=2622260 RepID=UPI00098B5F77|nr:MULTISPECIES: PAS domain S-box protein [unclassified Methylocaldum]MVF20702.1 PAS domain S-box protein [Methylocaldum sp. BRCS4]